MTLSRLFAIVGGLVGLVGTLGYFGFISYDSFALPLSAAGLALGTIAVLVAPRSIWLGVLAMLCSAGPIAFIAIGRVLGIKC
jgi:hypothetical protein